MLNARARSPFALFPVAVLVLAGVRPVDAARQATPPAPPAVATAKPAPRTSSVPATVTESQDAQQTRRELEGLLKRYPPTLGRVLKLDPALLGNPAYLAPYPGLAAFLAQHPEVLRNPSYFLANVELPESPIPAIYRDNPGRTLLMARGAVTFLVFAVVTAALLWLIKVLIDYRRWLRLSRAQAELHGKLLDRFSASQDLLAFIQTPAGKRFLESAPIALDAGAPPVAMPLRRILWAVEAGLVLAAGGVGLLFVSGRIIGNGNVSQSLYVLGVLGVSLGVGFVLSAIASFVLSKRLGVLNRTEAADVDRPSGPGV